MSLTLVREFWRCDCPDWSRGEPIGLQSIYHVYPRAWDNSQAGAKQDCKHILAVRMSKGQKLGEDFGEFNDPPLPYIPLPPGSRPR
jgi:hypothetical protein